MLRNNILASTVIGDAKEQQLLPAVSVVVYLRFYRAFIFIAGYSVCQLKGIVAAQYPTVQDMFSERLPVIPLKAYDCVSKRNI